MRRRPLILPLILLLAGINAKTQQLRRPLPATYTGLGAYSIRHTDVFSFTSNQASLAQSKSFAAGVYGERRFSMRELNNYIAAVALPTSSGNFGLKANYYGFSDYNETQVGLAYARKLGNKADLGAQFNYNGIRISGYGSDAAVSFELGTILHVTEKLHAGIHVNNPVGGKFGKNQQEKIASVVSFGMGYEASEKVFVSTELVKEEDQDLNVNAGLQYRIIPQLMARVGMSAVTSTGWLGVGLSLRSFRVDVAASYHPQLGITPGILLIFYTKTKEE